MGGALKAWEAAGQTTVLLPSGFSVRGVLPSPTEIIRRKLVPWQLRQAVQGMGGRKMSDLSEEQHAQLVEARRYQVAAFIRELAAPGTEEFEPVELTVDDLAKMPPADTEALDDLMMGIATAEMITTRSKVALGMMDAESAERVAAEEEGATVGGWTEFHAELGGDTAGQAGGAVGTASEQPARSDEPADSVPAGRRNQPQAGKGRQQVKA